MTVEDAEATAKKDEKTTFSTDKEIRSATKKDTVSKLKDSQREGLYLRVQPSGKWLWQYRFTLHGKEGTFSIGPYPTVSLATAREKRDKASTWVREGKNPILAQKEEQRKALEKSEDTLAKAWEGLNLTLPDISQKTMARREREFAKDLGSQVDRAVDSFTKPELSALLKKIAARAPSVALNIHGYLNGAFEHAVEIGWLTANPVPKVSILGSKKPKSHPALPPHRLGDFLVDLSRSNRLQVKSRVSMLLAILCAVRKQEATGARWSEIDLERGEWIISASRMKGRLEHYVPLSKQAVALLQHWRADCDPEQDLLFPNRRDPKRPMAGRSLNNVMDKLGYLAEGVPHGMRSCFSTHVNERFKHYSDAVERCLAHVEKDKVRGAYNRYEYKRERQQLMQAWANQLDKLETASKLRQQGNDQSASPPTQEAAILPARVSKSLGAQRKGVRLDIARSIRLSSFRAARTSSLRQSSTSHRNVSSHKGQ